MNTGRYQIKVMIIDQISGVTIANLVKQNQTLSCIISSLNQLIISALKMRDITKKLL